MMNVNPRLATVRTKAVTRVTIRWRNAQRSQGVYSRCIQVSGPMSPLAVEASAARSPGLRKMVPSTGTAVRATRSDARRAKLTVMAKGRKNEPTSP